MIAKFENTVDLRLSERQLTEESNIRTHIISTLILRALLL